MENLDNLTFQYNQLTKEIEMAQKKEDWVRVGELIKKRGEIEKILQKHRELQEIQKKIEEIEEILKKETNKELLELARKEKEELQEKFQILKKELQSLTKNKEKTESVIVEIRPGVGGEEAALFAQDLFSMYLKYANKKGWRVKILETKETDLGGIKEAILKITGKGVYSKLKYEGGVHRVQRIHETKTSGRIHTSTASVVILKKPEKAEIQIDPKDLKIETFRASGPGGQYVNRRESAVRITHIPTSIVVTCQSERTQVQNRENALAILQARLLKMQEEKQFKEIQKTRRSQIGTMERSEKIRTYNFPQDRVTDHRVKKTWHNIEEILAGELDPIVEELEKTLNKS